MSANAGITALSHEPLTMTIEGLEEVQELLNSLADSMKEETSIAMVTDAGNAVADWMRENVRNTFQNRTGALENSIFATVLTNDAGAMAFVGPNTSIIPYAMIQELGGDIYPKNARYLHFFYKGKEYFSKHVHLPARPYIAPAFNDHLEEIIEIYKEDIYAAIAEGCADL